MAHLSNSQKKSRNGFIALLVGILLILAATAYVLFEGITAKSAFLANQKLATALGETFSKRPMSVGKDDLAKVKYLSVSYNADDKQYSVQMGLDDFMTAYDKLVAKQEADKDADTTEDQQKLSGLIKSATFEGDENSVLTDLSYFTGLKSVALSSVPSIDAATLKAFSGVEELSLSSVKLASDASFADYKNLKTVSISSSDALPEDALTSFATAETVALYSVPLTDTSVFSTYTNLKNGYFNSNGITDVSDFAKLDLDKIEALDFTGNTIADWTPLLGISDKVTVANYYTIEADENGQQQYVPVTQTLTQYIEEQAKNASEGNTDNTADAANTADTAADETADETAAEQTTDGETAKTADEN